MISRNLSLICISFLFSVIVLSVGCAKKHDSIYGNVTVDGRITDEISGDPLPNTLITLNTVKLAPNGLGGTTPVVDQNRFITDTTDANGNYSFSLVANGEYEFEVVVTPGDLYVGTSSFKPDKNIKSNGAHTVDLSCNRSAHAKINITNFPPLDTAGFLAFSCLSSVDLHHFYKDTIVYIKINGGMENPSQVRLENSNITNTYLDVAANRWDTVTVQFNY